MNGHQCYNLHPWNSFYQHYLHQHAIMTQYIQQLTQSTSAVTSCNAHHTCHCGCHRSVKAPEPDRIPSAECYSSYTDSSSSSNASTTCSSSEYELEEEESYKDDDETEYEYELNVDAFIAMRAAKRELEKSSENKSSKSASASESNSVVLVNSDKEDFEFIDFGGYNAPAATPKVSHSIGGGFNKQEELKAQKHIMNYLYGEKSSTIGGLETAMDVNFERLCDIHQPAFWPVLPVRL